jgi:hypothetical protein
MRPANVSHWWLGCGALLLLALRLTNPFVAHADGPVTPRITEAYLVVSVDEGWLHVAEVYLLDVIASEREATGAPTLEVTLPEGAEGLSFLSAATPDLGPDEGRFVRTDAGFVDTAPFSALEDGSAPQMGFSYALPYSPGHITRFAYPVSVDAVTLVVSTAGIVPGQGWGEGRRLETPWGPADVYRAGPLAAGEPLTIVAAELMSFQTLAAGSTTPGPTPGEVGIGMVVLALGAALAWMLWRSAVPEPFAPQLVPLLRQAARTRGVEREDAVRQVLQHLREDR